MKQAVSEFLPCDGLFRGNVILQSKNGPLDFQRIWQQLKPYVDEQRWQELEQKLQVQLRDAKEWQQVCIGYFSQFAQGGQRQ